MSAINRLSYRLRFRISLHGVGIAKNTVQPRLTQDTPGIVDFLLKNANPTEKERLCRRKRIVRADTDFGGSLLEFGFE